MSTVSHRLRRSTSGERGLAGFIGAALGALLMAGVTAKAVSTARAASHWTSGFALAAAIGGAIGTRRGAASGVEDNSALLSLAGDFIVRHRIDGRVTAIEGDGLPQLALSDADLMGYGLVDRLHEDDRASFLEALKAAARDGCVRATTVRLRRDGAAGYVFVEVKCRASHVAGEGVFVSAFRESAAVPALTAQLEAAREEARLEKSLKDRLLANMSYELRTPLNAILGFSEILGDPTLAPAEPEKRLEYARIIHASADHLLSVVNLVLDMSRIEAGKFSILPEPMELEPLIRECCDMLRLRADTGKVTIVQSPLTEGLEIVADKGACRQIIVNLLSNAVKFTPPQGSVTIEARVEDGAARISVTDTGIGIKPDDLPRLGDPFFQVRSGYNRSFEGAGLGLSLVRGLVGLHDGSLILESTVGVGTRVTAVLPLAPKPVARRVISAQLHTIPRLSLAQRDELVGVFEEERRIA